MNRKKIPGYPEYEVSDAGEISSMTRTVDLTIHSVNGFTLVDLVDEKGNHVRLYLHKIVATAFLENNHPDTHKILIHLDGDTSNNHVGNLMWTNAYEIIRTGLAINKQGNLPQGLDLNSLFEYHVKKMQVKPRLLNLQQRQLLKYLNEEGISYIKLAVIFSRSTDYVRKCIKRMDKLLVQE